MGTTGGGVYKTTDGGNTWAPSGEKYFGGTIGAIGVFEPNPDIVYVGTGEWGIRGNVSAGDGVWKTTDGGSTWTHVGLEKAGQISRVRIHPTNADIVYASVHRRRVRAEPRSRRLQEHRRRQDAGRRCSSGTTPPARRT